MWDGLQKLFRNMKIMECIWSLTFSLKSYAWTEGLRILFHFGGDCSLSHNSHCVIASPPPRHTTGTAFYVKPS